MKNKLSMVCILTIALTSIFFGCTKQKAPSMVSKESSQYNFYSFLNKIDHFPYEASKARQDKVINGFSRLSLEMNKQTVKELMGDPDAEFLDYQIKKGRERFICSTWGYYIHRHDKEIANKDFDKDIFLHFDKEDKLYWAYWSVPNMHENEFYKQIGNPLPKKIKKSLDEGFQTDVDYPKNR